MAKELASSGIETTVITDAAIYAIMARVNKVGAAHAEETRQTVETD